MPNAIAPIVVQISYWKTIVTLSINYYFILITLSIFKVIYYFSIILLSMIRCVIIDLRLPAVTIIHIRVCSGDLALIAIFLFNLTLQNF